MPQRDPGVYLEDIEYYAGAAVRFISSYSLEEYLADEKDPRGSRAGSGDLRRAMNALYKVALTVAAKIPHSRDIIGFRNILGKRPTRTALTGHFRPPTRW